MFSYKGRSISRVGFIGFGGSNKALYEYLKKHTHGVEFILRSDKMPDKETDIKKCFIGERMLDEITEDVLFLSPSAAAVGGTDVGESPVSLHPVPTEGNNVWWEPGGKRWVSAAGLLCCPVRWVSKKGKRSVKCGQL